VVEEKAAMTTAGVAFPDEKGWLERLLAPIADVRRGEAISALLMTLTMFLILFALGNTTRQALWLPTSREAKYKAKQAVDSFCQRAGDVLQAGIVYLSTLLAFGIPAFAVLNIIFAGGWLAVAAGLNRGLRMKAQAGNGQL
jgi:ATP/ADP translocase